MAVVVIAAVFITVTETSELTVVAVVVTEVTVVVAIAAELVERKTKS